MRKQLAVVVASVFVLMLVAGVAQATVLQVVAVKTSDAAAYTREIMKMKAVMERLGSNSKLRIWQARYAGTDSGTVFVSIEYADLETFARDNAKASADPEFQKLQAGLAGLRTMISNSIFEELGE